MRILPGDPNKRSLKDRGLTFEMILEAIDSGGLLDVLPTQHIPAKSFSPSKSPTMSTPCPASFAARTFA